MNTDSSQFITGREVAVPDMLNARDKMCIRDSKNDKHYY